MGGVGKGISDAGDTISGALETAKSMVHGR